MLPPSYLEQLSQKINRNKEDHHKYVVVNSGTVHRINKDLCAQQPISARGEYHRNLIYEWTEGRQRLNGLVGVLKEYSLIYKNNDAASILRQANKDIMSVFHGTKFIIVPDSLVPQIEHNVGSLITLSLSKCYFID